MEIRKTKITELEKLMELYADARRFMAEQGNPDQWGTSYPSEALIKEDILSGSSYVCEEDGRIIATFYYRKENDSTYRNIYGGHWLNDEPYGVVHRITSDRTVRGAASFCLDWAFKQCGNLKIDTHRDNTVMQKLLQKNGFVYCGTIYIDDGTERLAYQKAAGCDK